MRIILMLLMLAFVYGSYNGIDALSGGALRHNTILSIIVIIGAFLVSILIGVAISNYGKKK